MMEKDLANRDIFANIFCKHFLQTFYTKRKEGYKMEYKFTTDNFETEVLKAELPVLVDFYADWCGPCKMMAPVISTIAEKFDGKLKVGKCNTDENMGLSQQYRIVSIPCFKVFKNGEVAETFVGAMSAEDFEDKLSALLG